MKQTVEGIFLFVKDNGIGMSESIKIEESNTLGLQLVTSLTEQMGGQLSLKCNNGTEVTILFNYDFE